MPRAGVRSVGCDVAHVGRTETREDRFRPFLLKRAFVDPGKTMLSAQAHFTKERRRLVFVIG